MRPLLALVLLALPAVAAADAPVAPPAAAPVAPPAAAPVAAPESEVFLSSEVLRQGSDESARRLETMLRAHEAELLACRATALGEGAEPLRYLQLDVRLKGDGTVRKARTSSSTNVPAVDACAAEVVRALRWDPPPMFPDRLLLHVTWAKPKVPDEA